MQSNFNPIREQFGISYSSSQHSEYQYAPLARDGSEFRLISLKHAAAWAQPISCEILHCKVSDEVQYLALSYTWGSLIDRQEVYVDDKFVLCTRNLYSALQHLRQPSEDLTLWVDAISIDQNNTDERSQQVRVMRHIYKNAKRLIVWLGPSSEDSHDALKLVSAMHEHSHDQTYIEQKIADPNSLEDFYALCRLFALDYWTRVWVVQEVFSAKDIIIYYGNDSIHWQTLADFQKLLFDNYDAQISGIFRRHPSMRNYILWYGPYALRLVHGDLPPTDLPDLFEIVLQHASKEATNPRDKIYAFVGISKQNESYEIDYSSSVPHVYMNFVYHTILQSKKLDIICSLKQTGNESEGYNLPSWVPDWGAKNVFVNASLTAYVKALYKICASGTTSAQVQFDLQNGAMIPSGGVIDTVYEVGNTGLMTRADDFEPALVTIHEWWSLTKTLRGTSVESQEAFVRALCFDYIGPQHVNDYFTKSELLQWILGAFSTLAAKICPDIHMDETLSGLKDLHDWVLYPGQEVRAMAWISQIVSNIRYRKLFLSPSGILGLAPQAIKQGDKICILLGCSSPVMLRPVDDHYILLGSAYVDGYMTGEALNKVEIQEFKIL